MRIFLLSQIFFDFYPLQSRPPVLDLFQEAIELDLVTLKQTSISKKSIDNITHSERQALLDIQNNLDLVVQKADKGGAVVLLDGGLYKKLDLEILGDTNTYTHLSNVLHCFRKKTKSLLQEAVAMEAINQNLADKLYVTCPSIPILHSLPKYHKQVFPPPLRPIVSGVGSMGEFLGIWIDKHLQPLVSGLPGFIRDTKHLVSIMDHHPWPQNTHWLTCDVSSLYPSIRHDKALVFLSDFLMRFSNYSPQVKTFLVMATNFLLRHNYCPKVWGREGGPLFSIIGKHLHGCLGGTVFVFH